VENTKELKASIEVVKEQVRTLERKRDLYFAIGIVIIIFSILLFFIPGILIKVLCFIEFFVGLIFVSTKAQFQLQINNLEASIDIANQELSDRVEKEKIDEISLKSLIFSKTFNVVGTKYRDKSDITSALKYISKNSWSDKYQGMTNKEIEDSFEKTFKFSNFSTPDFDLIPEPSNEYDTNAIRVFIDGSNIGYLPRSEANQVIEYINDKSNYVASGIVSITGGPYKEYDYTIDKVVSKNSDLGFKMYLEIHKK